MIEHRHIVDRIFWAGAALRIGPSDVALHLSSLAFDGALIPTWWMLCNGGAVVMPTTTGAQDPAYLIATMRRHTVTVLFTTPALSKLIVRDLAAADLQLPQRVGRW